MKAIAVKLEIDRFGLYKRAVYELSAAIKDIGDGMFCRISFFFAVYVY